MRVQLVGDKGDFCRVVGEITRRENDHDGQDEPEGCGVGAAWVCPHEHRPSVGGDAVGGDG